MVLNLLELNTGEAVFNVYVGLNHTNKRDSDDLLLRLRGLQARHGASSDTLLLPKIRKSEGVGVYALVRLVSLVC